MLAKSGGATRLRLGRRETRRQRKHRRQQRGEHRRRNKPDKPGGRGAMLLGLGPLQCHSVAPLLLRADPAVSALGPERSCTRSLCIDCSFRSLRADRADAGDRFAPPASYHSATRREARVRAGHRGHESRARRRKRPKTSDRARTLVPAVVFPQCPSDLVCRGALQTR